MHEGAYRFIESMVNRLDPRRSVIELGSRTVPGPWPCSGPVRPLFTSALSYTGVDIAPGLNVDAVADAAKWKPRPLVLVDTVVCAETLEHTPEAGRICANAFRLLAPGGVFIVTTAAPGRAPHSATDGGPLQDGEYYLNVDRDQLRSWLCDFGCVLIDTDTAGDIYALGVKC